MGSSFIYSFNKICCYLISAICLINYCNIAVAIADENNPLDALPNHCHFTSQIEQSKTVDSLPIPLLSKGKIYFYCQAGLIWITTEPVQQALIFTKKYYAFEQNGENSLARLNSQEASFLSELLLGIMGGDKDYIQHTFTVSSQSKDSFKLIPKSNFLNKVIQQISIQVLDAKDELIIDILQTDKTQLTIRALASSIDEQTKASLDHCVDIGFSKLVCTALFKPQFAANTLVKNIGQ